ncbi:MAG: dihydrofolate reductase, partial [Akkermansiaceae bacterium]
QNIVITRDPAWHHNGVESIHHPQELNELSLIDPQVFIIGGEQIYRFFLPILEDLIITHVPDCYEGDTQFPEYEHLFPHSELIWEQEEFVIKRHFK